MEVSVDEARIEQVMVNFINNAIKYAPESKKIEVNIKIVDAFSKIAITDEGPGIPKDELAHLFERYYRAHTTSRWPIRRGTRTLLQFRNREKAWRQKLV